MHHVLYFPSPLESSTVRSPSQNLLPTWLHITFWLSSSIVEKKSQVEDSCDCDVVFEAREGISCSLQISEFFTVAPRSNCALPPRASQSHSLSLVGMYCARPNFDVRRARASGHVPRRAALVLPSSFLSYLPRLKFNYSAVSAPILQSRCFWFWSD